MIKSITAKCRVTDESGGEHEIVVDAMVKMPELPDLNNFNKRQIEAVIRQSEDHKLEAVRKAVVQKLPAGQTLKCLLNYV